MSPERRLRDNSSDLIRRAALRHNQEIVIYSITKQGGELATTMKLKLSDFTSLSDEERKGRWKKETSCNMFDL